MQPLPKWSSKPWSSRSTAGNASSPNLPAQWASGIRDPRERLVTVHSTHRFAQFRIIRNRGGPKPTPRVLAALAFKALDGLADQDVHRDAAVLRLAFGSIVVRRRIRLGHPRWGQHAIGRPAAMLLQIVDDLGGAPLAETL